jgi:hypothetical protein
MAIQRFSRVAGLRLGLAFAALDPTDELAFTQAPLAADFERWQIAVANHALQRLG